MGDGGGIHAAPEPFRRRLRARADAGAVAAFYAPDAVYIGTGGDIAAGRETILAGLRREVPLFRDFAVEPASVGMSGNLAYDRGNWRTMLSIPGRPPQPAAGPYFVVYERMPAEGWRIKLHMAGRAP